MLRAVNRGNTQTLRASCRIRHIGAQTQIVCDQKAAHVQLATRAHRTDGDTMPPANTLSETATQARQIPKTRWHFRLPDVLADCKDRDAEGKLPFAAERGELQFIELAARLSVQFRRLDDDEYASELDTMLTAITTDCLKLPSRLLTFCALVRVAAVFTQVCFTVRTIR